VIDNLKNQLIKLDQREAELVKITNSLNLAQEVARIGSWDCDVESNYIYCSDPLFAILGIDKIDGAAAKYENLLAMIIPEDQERFDEQFQRTILSGAKMDIEYRVQRHDESIITVHTAAVAKRDHNGKVVRIIGILQDISEQVITENKLKESEEKFETIAKNIDVGIWSMDTLTNQLIYGSPAIEKITGYSTEDFLSGRMIWTDLIHPDDTENYWKRQGYLCCGQMIVHQYRIINLNGDVKWVEDKTFPTLNSEGQVIRLDGIIQDIGERKRNEEEINFFAYHDYLTELPNRRLFDQNLEQLISNYQGRNGKFSLFYLDMDRFKFVNDTLGHEIGDALLREISVRLSAVAGGGSVYRFSTQVPFHLEVFYHLSYRILFLHSL